MADYDSNGLFRTKMICLKKFSQLLKILDKKIKTIRLQNASHTTTVEMWHRLLTIFLALTEFECGSFVLDVGRSRDYPQQDGIVTKSVFSLCNNASFV